MICWWWREDILSVLLKTTLGLIVIQSPGLRRPQSLQRLSNRKQMPIEFGNSFNIPLGWLNSVRKSIANMNTQSTVFYNIGELQVRRGYRWEACIVVQQLGWWISYVLGRFPHPLLRSNCFD